MEEKWKKWPGSTIWIHGSPHPDPGDARNDAYRNKAAKAEAKYTKSLIKRLDAENKKSRSRAGKGGGGGSLMKQIGGGAAVGRKAIKKLMDEL